MHFKVLLSFHFYFYHPTTNNPFSATEKYIEGYVEDKLKKALQTQIEELEEKSMLAEQARAYFGEEMYKKLMEIDETRNDALLFDQESKIYNLSVADIIEQ